MPVDISKAHDQYARYCYLRDNGHLEFVQKADKCDNFVAGNQWDRADLAKLMLARRPAMTINKMLPTISTVAGEQIQNRVEVLFRPKNGSPAEVADALNKVWMQIAQNNQLPWVRSDVFWDGIVRSRGFYDVRLNFSDSMQGELSITQLNGKNVVIDSDAEEYDPDGWNDVIISKWMTAQDIEVLYNADDAEILKTKTASSYVYGYDSVERYRDRFSGMPLDVANYDSYLDPDGIRRTIRVLDRQYKKLDKQTHFVDIETGDMRAVPANWDRNRIAALLEKAQGKLNVTKKLIKRIRWCVTADDVVLHDDWSPFKHYTVVPYFPYFQHGRTLGIAENLLGPQEILNKASSQELHIINTTANSGWKVEENSLANMSVEEMELRGAETGLIVEYKRGSTPPEKITPNQVPTGLDRVSMKAEEHIKTISNVSDSMQGFDREDVAAKAIAYKRQAGSINLTKILDNLERTDFLLARNVLDVVQGFYTERRIVTITHDDVTREPETIVVNEVDPVTGAITNDLTLGEYSIIITSTPHRASLEDSQFEQAMALREAGIPIPDNIIIENSRLSRRSEIIKQMEAAKTSPEAQAQAELQRRGQEAEVANSEAEAEKKRAGAQLDMVRAQKEAQGGDELELQKMQAELQMEERRLQMEIEAKQQELALKREEMQLKMQFEQQKHAQDVLMRQEEHQQQMVIKKQQAEEQAVAQRAQAMRDQSAAPKEKSATPA